MEREGKFIDRVREVRLQVLRRMGIRVMCAEESGVSSIAASAPGKRCIDRSAHAQRDAYSQKSAGIDSRRVRAQETRM
jgi:hypothetical protein